MPATTARVSTDRFTYDAAQNIFIGEASDLLDFRTSVTLVSHKTGAEVEFTVESTQRDEAEGELLGWILKPVNAPNERAAACRLHLLND
jgi:hypothetical protein